MAAEKERQRFRFSFCTRLAAALLDVSLFVVFVKMERAMPSAFDLL